MVHILTDNESVGSVFMRELRDIKIQGDPMRFRKNLERLGQIFAYELSKTLKYKPKEIKTPLGTKKVMVPADQLVIATILRAGSPLHHGLLTYFDHAENAFISAYRKHTNEIDFEVEVEYLASPSITDKVLILSDPMLATGQSMVLSYMAMLKRGKPKHIHVVSVIASEEGVNYARKHLPENTTFWIGDVDAELNDKKYIVPGLGDAGDLAYGTKL